MSARSAARRLDYDLSLAIVIAGIMFGLFLALIRLTSNKAVVWSLRLGSCGLRPSPKRFSGRDFGGRPGVMGSFPFDWHDQCPDPSLGGRAAGHASLYTVADQPGAVLFRQCDAADNGGDPYLIIFMPLMAVAGSLEKRMAWGVRT